MFFQHNVEKKLAETQKNLSDIFINIRANFESGGFKN